MRGYAGKFLDINLSEEKIKETKFDERLLRNYIGGRGLATKILWDRLGETWETLDPFEPENILTVFTGPLTGFFPGGRTCISGKSPQSNGVVGSTVAGEFGIELKCAGYDGLIITGRASKPKYIAVLENEVLIKDANYIWGKDGKKTLKIITGEEKKELKEKFSEYGELKEPSVLYIGPAGENQARIAAVMSKWSHAAGYGGYGGVMGSKNLKAIIAKGFGPLPEVEDISKVSELIKTIDKKVYRKGGSMRRWGTGHLGYNVGAKTSSEPVRNWQDEWHDKKSFAVDKFEQRLWVKRYWADFGCPTSCLKIAVAKTGKYKGAITDCPDYELQAYLGTNLGIFTPEDCVYMCSLIDDLGLCGIQAGNVLGFIAELCQRDIVGKDDLNGIKLEWGNTEAFAELAEKIAKREGIGNLLAEGSYRAAMELGKRKHINLSNFVIHEKGMAIGAHGIRSRKDYVSDISYACSVQAGDHTSVAYVPIDHGTSELNTILHDSGVYCSFNTFSIDRDLIWAFYDAVTGWKMREGWYETTGSRILNLQRALLLLGGPDLKWKAEIDDKNPPRFHEPLPSGPYKGRVIRKKTVDESKQEYYELVGWDERGLPKSETLRRLGLQDVEMKLKKSRVM